MEIGIDEQSTALLCLSLICVSLRPHSNNMATDLRHIWFQAIEEQDLSQIYRLLYSTPNADAGVGRLNWLIDHSGLPITEFIVTSCSVRKARGTDKGRENADQKNLF